MCHDTRLYTNNLRLSVMKLHKAAVVNELPGTGDMQDIRFFFHIVGKLRKGGRQFNNTNRRIVQDFITGGTPYGDLVNAAVRV